MKNYPLISVIIPVYNIEKYLNDCVKSVLTQSYANLEIILVNDGSSDNSPHICDSFADENSHVTVIHKKNGGPADARNAGLDIFKGDYLLFVDSDDLTAPYMVECLYNNLLQYNADISCCNIYGFYAGDDISRIDIENDKPVEMTNEQAVEKILTKQMFAAPYAKLYKRHIFKSIRYPVGKLHEDSWVITDVFMAAEKIVCCAKPMYYYRQHKNSIIHTYDISKRILPELEMHEWRQGRIEALCPNLTSLGDAFLYGRYAQAARRILSDKDYSKTPESREILNTIYNKAKKHAERSLISSHLKWTEKAQVRILKINTYLYELTLQMVVYRKKLKKRKRQKLTEKKALFE